MSIFEKVDKVKDYILQGKVWMTPSEAGNLLDIDPYTMNLTAKDRETLGNIVFLWCGKQLKISTASVLRFLTGGLDLQTAMGGGEKHG